MEAGPYERGRDARAAGAFTSSPHIEFEDGRSEVLRFGSEAVSFGDPRFEVLIACRISEMVLGSSPARRPSMYALASKMDIVCVALTISAQARVITSSVESGRTDVAECRSGTLLLRSRVAEAGMTGDG